MQVCFEYAAAQVEEVESSWSFVLEAPPLSVPFLLVGVARDPLVYLDKAHLDFGELPVGRWRDGVQPFHLCYRFKEKVS